jgi:hypothetical protein
MYSTRDERIMHQAEPHTNQWQLESAATVNVRPGYASETEAADDDVGLE